MPSQGQSTASPAAGRRAARGRRVVGLRQIGEWYASPSLGKFKGRARHQKGTTGPGTDPHGVTQDGTTTGENGLRRYTRGPAVRINTEEVTGSIQ